MPIDFHCPHCRTHMQVSEEFAGQTGPCAVCTKSITIPPLPPWHRPTPPQQPFAPSVPQASAAPPTSSATVSDSPPPAASTEPTDGQVSISAGLGILASTAAALALSIVLAVPLLALARPLVATALGSTYRTGCHSNLQKIGLAFQAYHQQYGSYPPAFVADKAGKPMHSWRVLILPYLGPREKSLYLRYTMSEPWDGPSNIWLAAQAPEVYRCPANFHLGDGEMSYRVVVGPGTCFPGTKAIAETDILDGPEGTILVVEAYNSAASAWTQPVDLDARTLTLNINGGGGNDIGGEHPGGAHVLTADGRIHFLRENIAPQALNAGLSRAGGDVPPPGTLDEH